MAVIGFIALILALTVSIYSAIAFILGSSNGYVRLTSSARTGVMVVCGLISVAVYFLYYALLSHDFQLEYVASHTSRNMPLIYNISAFWAGNAGSLLLMTWLLSLAAFAVVRWKRKEDTKFTAYASSVIIGTLIFFLLLLIFIDNPFKEHAHTLSDGQGLNPLLENPGMVIHPPLLLAGYIAFTIPFALAIAALVTRRPDSKWLSGARSWALAAWLLLGAGNLIGAWWAYVELGWGGYWGWDPVENAGLMPWLIGTALLHSLNSQRKIGTLKAWTIVLILLAFNLCIFGMFLNRSDFLSSVHSYSNTEMETMFLVFLVITLLGPLLLMLSRRNYLRSKSRDNRLISKENFFLLTNLLFVLATFVILLGTLLPWLSETITGTVSTVGASFFNKTAAPIFLAIILLAGVCILLGWRRTPLHNLFRHVICPLVTALALCLILYLVGIREWYALILFPLCFFAIFAHLSDLYRKFRTRNRLRKQNPLKSVFGLLWGNRSYYGGMTVHLGIALIAIGVIGSSFYQSEAKAELLPGESMTIKDYTITYEDMASTYVNESKTRIKLQATMSVYDGDRLVTEMKPEAYYNYSFMYEVWIPANTEVDISAMPYWWFPQEDLYLVLDGQTEDGSAIFQVIINPLVSMIWIGGGVLLLGGLFAFWPARNGKDSSSTIRNQKEDTDGKTGMEDVIDPKASPPNIAPGNSFSDKGS